MQVWSVLFLDVGNIIIIAQTKTNSQFLALWLDIFSCYCNSVGNCCFLTCIQISQEAGKVVWYSHLFKSFPQFAVIHMVKALG